MESPAVVCLARQSAPSSPCTSCVTESRHWPFRHLRGSRSKSEALAGDVTLPLLQLSPGQRKSCWTSRNSQGRKKFRDWHLKFASNLCQENKNVKLNSVLFSTLNIFIFLMMKIEVNVSREHQDDILFADSKQTFDSQSSS